MAAQLGVSTASVGRWISGKNSPKRPALMAWAAITGVSLDWLENGERPVHVAPASQKLPRLDSNQQPFDYLSSLVRTLLGRLRKRPAAEPVVFGPLALLGPIERPDAVVIDLDAYRAVAL